MDDNFSPLKTDIDPVFKANSKKEIDTENSPLITGVYGALNNQDYVPDQGNQNQTTNSFPEKNAKASIRTYKDDIQSAIQASHLSSVNIAMAENEKMHSRGALDMQTKERQAATSTYSKSKIIFLVSIVLIFIGLLAIGITYSFNQQSTPVAQTQNVVTSFITTEYRDELNVNSVVKDRFVSALSSRLNDIQVPANNTYNIYITTGTSSSKRLITSKEFITLSGMRIPDIVTRTLISDFMVGMYSFNQNLPFVIFKTSSFENTYAGMIDWEKDIAKDFSVLFRLGNGGGDISTALTPTTERKFEDEVVVNKDVRIIRDDDKKTIFLYAILDKNTIVITVNENSFKEIVSRLNKEKGLKR